MLNHQVIDFLTNNAHFLTSEPINGHVLMIIKLFNSIKNHKHMSIKSFVEELEKINKIDKYSVVLAEDKTTIEFINNRNLELLNFTITNKSMIQEPFKQRKKRSLLSLDYLNELLAPEPRLQDSKNLNYSKLMELLNYENASHKLSIQKIAQTTPMLPFLEVCNDIEHSRILSQINRNQKVNNEITLCTTQKIHFIPVIKPHTDISLGDCSYLDTCHKLDSCRYVHYIRHLPEKKIKEENIRCDEFNSRLTYWEKINPWNNNGAASNISRTILPKQWINCDVRKFDFNVLGKFAAVIADPAWNIHMNLPYGTCNDNELLNLPLSNVQDEGILLLWVTGRAIEIGKESLMKWGYTIKNEMVWIKTNQLSRTICTGRTGHWLNHSKEHLLVGVKGNPVWLDRAVDIDFIVSSTRETSRKPDELYGMVERLVGPHARKLEIFGRDHNTRPGWFTIGNQLKGNNVVEHEVHHKFQKSLLNTR